MPVGHIFMDYMEIWDSLKIAEDRANLDRDQLSSCALLSHADAEQVSTPVC